MKKSGLLSIIIMTAMCFTACGNNAQNVQPPTAPAPAAQTQSADKTETAAEEAAPVSMETNRPNTQDYTLKEVVVMSRHNIRSPLSSNGAANVIATPHEWFKWTANSSELSLRGGVLETMMGQYFRKWLEDEKLIPENYLPEDGEVRFFANTKQRTLATAQYFSSGFLPTANVRIEQNGVFGKMCPTFDPKIDFYSDSYAEAVQKQFEERGGAEIAADLEENYKLLADVVDYTESEGYKSGELKDFVTNDTTITPEPNEEMTVGGSLTTACTVSDALVLQYYEEPDPVKAAFGKELTTQQWEKIADITTKYVCVRHGLPLIAINAAHPLLREIRSEFTMDNRKFTFLCGHDANIMGIVTALEAEDYQLPYTLEKKTPIGVKLVFEKWEDKDGKEFAAVELVYQSTEQLRDKTILTLDTPPAIYALSFEGMEKNADGLYSYDDVIARLDKAISEYDDMVNKYSDDGALDEAA